jgi:hypothetical protein
MRYSDRAGTSPPRAKSADKSCAPIRLWPPFVPPGRRSRSRCGGSDDERRLRNISPTGAILIYTDRVGIACSTNCPGRSPGLFISDCESVANQIMRADRRLCRVIRRRRKEDSSVACIHV